MTPGLEQKDSTWSSSEWDPEDLKDPLCNKDNPITIQFEDISAAAYRIKSGIVRTSCDPSHMNNDVCMEYMQFTGSFKERGARYTLIKLILEQKAKGVIAASAGNHAQALAFHGGLLKIPVTVVMPIVAPIMKVEIVPNMVPMLSSMARIWKNQKPMP
jgi:threonine dehydratase